tara:strand:- start:3351 stop:4058 length:708 start_codon:yes stop_codon:yes gene_type:complete
MSVNVNTVYSRVLAIMNKEQRGYLTPQEFNIFANQAQMDIFEQYFYDLNQFLRLPGNSTSHADMVDILNEKIGIFTKTANLTYGSTSFNKPDDLYRLTAIEYDGVTADRLTRKEFLQINKSPLTKPSNAFPVYTELADGYDVQGDDEFNAADQSGAPRVIIEYIKTPTTVSWAGNVVNGVSLYNASNSTNFDLHPSEETELVMKILQLAGIAIKDINLANFAGSEDIKSIQQEKA